MIRGSCHLPLVPSSLTFPRCSAPLPCLLAPCAAGEEGAVDESSGANESSANEDAEADEASAGEPLPMDKAATVEPFSSSVDKDEAAAEPQAAPAPAAA